MSDRSTDRPFAASQAEGRPGGLPLGAPFRPPQREAYRPTPPGRMPSPPLNGPSRPALAATGGDHRRLLVGREIELSGAISACDTLVVEGQVETDLERAVMIQITQTGLFKGRAAVDHAEIAGTFEGDLTVRKTLSIGRSGRVSGTVRYGTLEIEAGGRLSGDVEPLDAPPQDVHHRALSRQPGDGGGADEPTGDEEGA